MPDRRLTVVPSVPVWVDGEALVLDRKFLDGVQHYVELWPGRVECVLRRAGGAPPEFGVVRRPIAALPFVVRLLEDHGPVRADHLVGAEVVLAAADDFAQLHVSALCRRLGVRCVYVIEYIPETRHQIVALEAPNRFVRLRREWFIRRAEQRRRRAFALADGLQANGTPAYDEYHAYANRLLYFDTRVKGDAMVSDEALSQRLDTASSRRPLRLAFSGRLIAMKGADHLIGVAALLRDSGVPYHLTIYGSGELEAAMRARIAALGLERQVTMRGTVDFDAMLVPEVRSDVDAYLMLHRQSDPSCTYLETLSCGVPIVGYRNRALAGILARADVGSAVEMDDVAAVADAVRALDFDRSLLARQSRNAAAFARRHSFEDTYRRRIDHLRQLVPVAR